jgi:hypothetical protein
MSLVELIFLVLVLIIIGLTSAALQFRYDPKYDSCSCGSGCAIIGFAGYIFPFLYSLLWASSSYYGSIWTGLFLSLLLILFYPTYIGYLAHDLRTKHFTKQKHIAIQIFAVFMTLLCIGGTFYQALTVQQAIEALNDDPEVLQATVRTIRYQPHTKSGGGYFTVRTSAGRYYIHDSVWGETISPEDEISFVKDLYFDRIYSTDNLEMTPLGKFAFCFHLTNITIIIGFAIYGYVMLFIHLKKIQTKRLEI